MDILRSSASRWRTDSERLIAKPSGLSSSWASLRFSTSRLLRAWREFLQILTPVAHRLHGARYFSVAREAVAVQDRVIELLIQIELGSGALQQVVDFGQTHTRVFLPLHDPLMSGFVL